MIKKALAVSAVYALSMLALANEAKASGFATVGTGCVPIPAALDFYADISHGVQHKSGSTTPITFICAIPNAATMTSPSKITISYSDTSNVAGNKVTATYYKANKNTAAVTTVGSVNTDQSSPTLCLQTTNQTCYSTFTDTFDPTTYFYLVKVFIDRTSTSNTEVFWGVTVE